MWIDTFQVLQFITIKLRRSFLHIGYSVQNKQKKAWKLAIMQICITTIMVAFWFMTLQTIFTSSKM